MFLNLLFTGLVLLGAFAAIFFSTYLTAKQDIQTKLLALPAMKSQGNVSLIPAPGSVLCYLAEIKMDQAHTESAEFFVLIVDKDGNISIHDEAYGHVEEYYLKLVNAAWKEKKPQNIVMEQSKAFRTYIVPSEEYAGEYEVYFLDIVQYRNSMFRLLKTFLLIGPISLFGVLLVSWYVSRRAVEPVEESWQRQRRFVADASHELKTPLAIISANAEALLTDDGMEKEKWIRYIQDEVTRMSELVSSLLYLAKTNDVVKTDHAVKFDVSGYVRDVLIRYETLFYEKGIQLNQSIEEHISITGEQSQIDKVISVLLDNAEKYTNPNGTISIVLEKRKNMAILEIRNTGEGIPAEDLPYIFERFYRVDKSRSSKDDSYGLGLSIAKSIVNQIGGELLVSSVEKEYTSFVLKLKI